jgi:hypothetical protein
LEKKKVSTLDCVDELGGYPLIDYYRCSGNSTRLIDRAIQLLYMGKIVVVQDHWQNGQHKEANRYLFEAILKRLSQEHQLTYLIKNKKIKIDKLELQIELV